LAQGSDLNQFFTHLSCGYISTQTHNNIMFRLAATLATLAAAKELVNANFDAEVFDSGKNSIVKFQAPW